MLNAHALVNVFTIITNYPKYFQLTLLKILCSILIILAPKKVFILTSVVVPLDRDVLVVVVVSSIFALVNKILSLSLPAEDYTGADPSVLKQLLAPSGPLKYNKLLCE